MSEVTLTIGRRSYTVACADGQEAHVRAMGADIAERLRQLGPNQSTNDAKNILFAALILADELFEERQKAGLAASSTSVDEEERFEALENALADAREEQERLQQHLANANRRLAAAEAADARLPDIALLGLQLERLAETLEKSASALERAS